jgi:hypothetical protein
MNDKEVKELMLEAYRMGDKEAAVVIFCFRFLPAIVAAIILLAFAGVAILVICCALWGKPEPKPVTHPAQPVQVEVEKSN